MTCELCLQGHPQTSGNHYRFEKLEWVLLGPCTNPGEEPVRAGRMAEKHRAQLAEICKRMERLTEKPKPKSTFTERSTMREPGEDDDDE